MLFYGYKSKCPRCNTECNHYLILTEPEVQPTIYAEGQCKCGYKGVVECRYIGRYQKDKKNINNPDIIDPH